MSEAVTIGLAPEGQPWRMPDWMRPYLPLMRSGGGPHATPDARRAAIEAHINAKGQVYPAGDRRAADRSAAFYEVLLLQRLHIAGALQAPPLHEMERGPGGEAQPHLEATP